MTLKEWFKNAFRIFQECIKDIQGWSTNALMNHFLYFKYAYCMLQGWLENHHGCSKDASWMVQALFKELFWVF